MAIIVVGRRRRGGGRRKREEKKEEEEKKQKLVSVSKYIENLESPYIAGTNIKWYSHFGKQSGSTTKIKWRVTI